MLNFFLADRIKETSNSVGTGPFNLDGAVNGFASFGDFFASGDIVFYAVTDNADYEVGSGIYEMNGSNRALTRFPLRNSNMNSGPYYVNGTSNSGPSAGQNGYFHPLWLTRSAAISGVGFANGPYSEASGYTFDEFPGQTFFGVPEYPGIGTGPSSLSGVDFNASGAPVNFNAGVKEVFCTYPGKTSVYNTYGLDPRVKEPQRSGVAIWENEQVINYDSDLLWDTTNKVLNIKRDDGVYAIDVGGDIDWSIVRASGFIDGGSGVYFSGVAGSFSGGRQLEPFLRNELNNETGSDALLELSGVVDQGIMLKKQVPAVAFMGPTSDCACVDDYPTFRTIELADLPAELADAFNHIRQQDIGIDGESANISPNDFIPGMVAIYHSSGNITYDSGIFFDADANSLVVGGDASIDAADYAIHAYPDMGAQRGHFDQIIFENDIVRVGSGNGVYENANGVFFTINMGAEAGTGSGVFHGIMIGHRTGGELNNSSGVIAVGTEALRLSHQIDNSVAIGEYAGYLSSGNDNFITVGTRAGAHTSGIVDTIAIGKGAAESGVLITDSILMGEQVAFSGEVIDQSILMGSGAAFRASGVDNVIGIGKNTLRGASGVELSALVGHRAASGAFNLSQTVGVGSYVFGDASGYTSVVGVGQDAARYGSDLEQVVAIGYQAAQSGLELRDTIAVGQLAASEASGTHNIYMGFRAGIEVSGYQNIEIIASGAAASFLGTEASGKLNIGEIIVGDVYNSKLTVGNPADASVPNATLEVQPADAEDIALLVSHVGSGGSNPYFALQSGDATTFYHITNSGDVITSGCMNPSGGLLLEPITPLEWMNNTDNRLYNDGGTLKFNGAAVGGAGGFSSFFLTNGAVANDEITDGQVVTISGVSGVEAQYDPTGGGFFRISASGLSGVLQDQITAQTYSFFSSASGDGARNNQLYEQVSQSVLALSGISGVGIDFESQTDGTNNSGIFVIGYNPSTTYTFDAVASGDGLNNNDPKTMVNNAVLAISGVSGIKIDFLDLTDGTNDSGVFIVGGTELWSKASGEWNYSQILENTQSGVAISGIAAYASGQVDQFTILGGASGVKSQDNTYILDPDGSGYLQRLLASDTSGVVIGYQAAHDASYQTYASGVVIGLNAGSGSATTGTVPSVLIGHQAGINQIHEFTKGMIAIGERAGADVFASDDAAVSRKGIIAIGREALYQASGVTNSLNSFIALGEHAGEQCVIETAAGSRSNVLIGHQAGYQYKGSDGVLAIGESVLFGTNEGVNNNVIAIGDNSAQTASGLVDSIFIGSFAGLASSGVTRGVMIGEDVGVQSYDATNPVWVGKEAGRLSQWTNQCVFIGPLAGYNHSGISLNDRTRAMVAIGEEAARDSHDMDSSVCIGRDAGRESVSVQNCIFIGPWAGYKITDSRNSIILSNRGTQPSRDLLWADEGELSCLDIGGAIQGFAYVTGGSVHIGETLNTYDGGDNMEYDSKLIDSSALSLTPRQANHNCIQLHFTQDATQTGSLIKTMAMAEDGSVWAVAGSPGQSDSYKFNSIVSNFGFLEIPVADSSTGTGANRKLFEDNALLYEIPKNEDGHLVALREGNNRYLCVSIGDIWHRVQVTQW